MKAIAAKNHGQGVRRRVEGRRARDELRPAQLSRSLGLETLHHTGVPVRDFDASLRFWHETLGIPLSRNQPKGNPAGVKWLALGDHELHMFTNLILGDEAVRVKPSAEYRPGRPTFVFSTSKDVEAHCAARGVPTERHTIDLGGKRDAVLVRDPNGYWIAFIDDERQAESATPLSAFRGMLLPVTSTRLAMREWTGFMGLPALPRASDDARFGVDAGLGVKLMFERDPVETHAFGSMHGEPPRDFHVSFAAPVGPVRDILLARGMPPAESAVDTEGGGGACQLFAASTTARTIVEVIDFVDDTAGCAVKQFTRPKNGKPAQED
jgi:catechol 2,3-dioxygenase-like lactoylglutathione lyase family enzyme